MTRPQTGKLNLKSGFAIVDITTGRTRLASKIKKGGGVKVRIDVLLTERHSDDDGTSIEFSGEVTNLKVLA